MKKGGFNRRGLSPVIASVLMILLVLVLAGIIFFWARGFIGEQIEKFGKPVEQACSSISFKVERVGDDKLEILNDGNVDIFSFNIKMIKGGDSETSRFAFPVEAGKAVENSVTLTMEDDSYPDEVIIYPALVGNVRGKSLNKPFTCLDEGVMI